MRVIQQIETQGSWLFRWRSFLPFLLMPLLAMALGGYRRPLASDGLQVAWSLCCVFVSLLGLAVRCMTVGRVPEGTSGRNTRSQVADQLNTRGIYSMVRHPLYLGNFLIGLGVFLAPCHLWLAMIYALAFWLYYERIIAAEETFLAEKFPSQFPAWAAKTPTIWPHVSLWQPAGLPFSPRTVLRREYTGLLLVVVMHTGLQLAKNRLVTGNFSVEPVWWFALGTTAFAYVALRTMKKRTDLLTVAGR